MKQYRWFRAVLADAVFGDELATPPTLVRRTLQGAVLGLGAPFGWLALQVAWGQVDPIDEVASNLALYAYLTIGSTLAFVLFAMRISTSETQLHVANRDLTTLAVTDALTGLMNSRFFQARLTEAVAETTRSGRPLSLLVMDLDRFKVVNDTHGHPVGDEVLRELARRIHASVRANDTAARVGGEEFAVILGDTNLEGARLLAERIRASVSATRFQTAAGPLSITISGGVAAWEHETSDELYAAADGALYAAKNSGRNQVVVAELEAQSSVAE